MRRLITGGIAFVGFALCAIGLYQIVKGVGEKGGPEVFFGVCLMMLCVMFWPEKEKEA